MNEMEIGISFLCGLAVGLAVAWKVIQTERRRRRETADLLGATRHKLRQVEEQYKSLA